MCAQLHPTLCNPTDCISPGSSVHRISRREYWDGLPFPLPGDLPDPGIEPAALASPVLGGRFVTSVAPGKPTDINDIKYLSFLLIILKGLISLFCEPSWSQTWRKLPLVTIPEKRRWLFNHSVMSNSMHSHAYPTPGFPVLHCLLEFAHIHVHWVNDAIQPSHPLLPPSMFSLYIPYSHYLEVSLACKFDYLHKCRNSNLWLLACWHEVPKEWVAVTVLSSV